MALSIKRKILLNGITVLATIVLFLIILEVSLALFYPQQTSSYQPSENPTEYHELLGWFTKANYQDTLIKCHQRVTRTFNSQGFRDVKGYSYEKSEGKKRVLVLGDSFMFGEHLDDSELYTTRLQEFLGEEYEVLNFGVTGYGTDQELMLFITEGLKYNPDIVVMGFFQNDILNVGWHKVGDDPDRGNKPSFVIEQDGSLTLKHCCPVKKIEKTITKEEPLFFERFHTYILVRDGIKGFDYLFFEQEKKSFFNSYIDSEYTQIKDYSRGPEFAILFPRFLAVTAMYDRLLALGEENGFSVILLNLPTNTQADPKIREEFFSQYHDISIDDFDKRKVNKLFDSYVQKRPSLTYIDLLPIFEEEGNIGEKYNIFYPCDKDLHWNGLGAQRTAEETASKILES